MANSKFYASSLLALTLLVPYTSVRANFSTLTEQTRSEIMHDSAIVGLAVAAVSGSIALASDVSNQSHTKRTFWQKLQNVDWATVVAVSAGCGALGALVCGIYKYSNAPEWAFNSLSDECKAMQKNLQEVAQGPVIQAVMNNDAQDLKRVCDQTDFPLVACVDRLNQTLMSTAGIAGYSGAEAAHIKKDLEALMHCRVPEVAQEAGKLLAELNASNAVSNLKIFQERLQDWIIDIKNNPSYLQQLEKKADLALMFAKADSARRVADAQQQSAYAQQRIARAKESEANARWAEALRPKPAPVIVVTPAPVVQQVVRPIVVQPTPVVVRPTVVVAPRPPLPPAPLKPRPTVNFVFGKRK